MNDETTTPMVSEDDLDLEIATPVSPVVDEEDSDLDLDLDETDEEEDDMELDEDDEDEEDDDDDDEDDEEDGDDDVVEFIEEEIDENAAPVGEEVPAAEDELG